MENTMEEDIEGSFNYSGTTAQSGTTLCLVLMAVDAMWSERKSLGLAGARPETVA